MHLGGNILNAIKKLFLRFILIKRLSLLLFTFVDWKVFCRWAFCFRTEVSENIQLIKIRSNNTINVLLCRKSAVNKILPSYLMQLIFVFSEASKVKCSSQNQINCFGKATNYCI